MSTIKQYNNLASEKIVNFFKQIVGKEEENVQNENIAIENLVDQNKVENIEQETADINEKNNEIITQEDTSSISEMELDIQNLKAAYNFIKPINGIVSSGFGARESEYQNVTGYHTGIDLAAEKNTLIRASMQGIVELVSSEGDYGNHIKIRCNNVSTLYAHCSKIYVKEGQIVAQNQVIGTVGSTGNSTGPHLHFEIRVEDRFIDPSKIITF